MRPRRYTSDLQRSKFCFRCPSRVSRVRTDVRTCGGVRLDNTGGAINRFHLPHPSETEYVSVPGTNMLPNVYVGPYMGVHR